MNMKVSKKKLKRHQVNAISAYVAELQENMRLCGWYLKVSNYRAGKSVDCNACIWIGDEAHAATIYIDKTFMKLDRDEQRKVLVHELCHLIMEPVSHSIQRNSLPRGKNNHANDNLHPTIELAVDDYARLIAEHQPLPARGWLDRPEPCQA